MLHLPEGGIVIKISKLATGTPVPVYLVEIDTKKSTWPEHFPTEDHVRAFVRGVKAGFSMVGRFDVYEDWGDILSRPL